MKLSTLALSGHGGSSLGQKHDFLNIGNDWSPLMQAKSSFIEFPWAISLIGGVPIVVGFLALQRFLVANVAAGSIK